MRVFWFRFVLILCLSALAQIGEPAEALAQAGTEEPAPTQKVNSPEPILAPDFALIDQDEHPLRLSSLRGKVVVLDFIYTRCPGPCPILSRKFAHLQRRLGDHFGKEVMLLSITIDPQHDTTAVLKQYAQRYRADTSGWKFLTGSSQEIINVAFQYGVDYHGQPGKEINHLVATYIIDQDGNVVTVFRGPSHTVAELLVEVEGLLAPLNSAGG
jgi:protein SCO1/2